MEQILNLDACVEKPEDYCNGWVSSEARYDILHAAEGLPKEDNNTDLSWEDSLEELCEDASKNHFIDVHERKEVIRLISSQDIQSNMLMCDFGASSGHMIAEVAELYPENQCIACDLYESGLRKSYKKHSQIMHIQMNLCQIPFQSNSIHSAMCLNVLEHIEDDLEALREIYRVMVPGGRVCIVVPYGKKLYDYYDESIFHKRRYGKGEVRSKAENVGFKVLFDNYLGTTIYVPFAIKKLWNKFVGSGMSEEQKRLAFERDNNSTKDSKLGHILMNMEYSLISKIHFPFGIRNIILVEK